MRVPMRRQAVRLHSGSATKAGLERMPRRRSSSWRWWLVYCEPSSSRSVRPRAPRTRLATGPNGTQDAAETAATGAGS